MHLVLLNQYYPPDAAPTGVMLAAVVEELAAQGHAVTVICAEGGYAGGRLKTSRRKTQEVENEGGFVAAIQSEHLRALKHTRSHLGWPKAICDRRTFSSPHHASSREERSSDGHRPPLHAAPRVLRIRATRFGRGTFVGKVMDYLSYYVGVAWMLLWLRPRPQRIVALTTPPYLSVLARVCSKIRGGDHAHWVMDLYPDVMVAHGMLREGSLPHRVLAGLARWGFGGRRCAAVLTLGPDMAERVGEMLSVVGCRLAASPHIGYDARRAPLHSMQGPRGAAPSNSLTTDNRIQWIPLWGEGEEERRTSNIEHPPSPIGYGGTSRTLNNESKDHLPSTIHDPRSLRHARGWQDDELVVMYSGNMGLGHRFGEILDVIEKEAGGRNQETGVRSQRSEVGGQRVGNVAAVCDRRSESDVEGQRSEVGGQKIGNVAAGNLTAEAPAMADDRRRSESEAEHLPSPIPDLQFPITDHSPRFVFFGGGKRRGEIERFVAAHPEAAVELHDYAPAADLGLHLRSADVHLASLAAEWTGTMVPSKLQGIFHAARPVIFIGEATSSIGRWVVASGGGWVVAPGDVQGLERALEEARDPLVRESRGRAAKVFAEANFDKLTNVRRVAEVLACALV